MFLTKFKKKIIEAETRPVVLHEIPGRVRFGVKILKRLKQDNLPLAEHLKTLLEEIPAFNGIKLNNLSGSILVSYDTSVTDSKGIKVFLQKVVRYLIGYTEELSKVPEKSLPEILERLSVHIRNSTNAELEFSPVPLDKSFWSVVDK